MPKPLKHLVVVIACLFAGLPHASAQLNDVGSIARNFTIVNHKTGQPLNLYDYRGSVILLDFFAWWCPFCRAQSPQIESGIVDYYEGRRGNSNGVPVQVITVSFACDNQAETDRLINLFGLDTVADDCSLIAYNQFGVSGQPYYVIINGVTNSTSHAAWEVLHRQSSYGGTTAPLSVLRGVIERVHSGPPAITNWRLGSGGRVEFNVQAQLGRTNRVEASSNLVNWTTVATFAGTNATVVFQDSAAATQPSRFFRVMRQ